MARAWRSAEVATRTEPRRLPSPTAWPRSLGSRSEDACPRRQSPDGRRHRREPTQSERRVRARLPLVGRTTGSRHGTRRRRRRRDGRLHRRATLPGKPVRVGGVRASAQQPGRTRWRCSPWPRSSMLLATLVAAAGFAVIAQRRLRQLGMLAAIGATGKHLRLVLLTNGTVVGAIGALLGTIAGLALWVALVPTLEPAFGHRIDPVSLPWTLLAMVVLFAVLGAAAAAGGPGGRSRASRSPSPSRRDPGRAAHRSALVAAVLIPAGFASLALSNQSRPLLIIAGIVATILGTLLLGPLAIRLVARAAGRSPIAVRLALRDLARYQARSGSSPRRDHPCTRDRGRARRRRGGRGAEVGRRAARPLPRGRSACTRSAEVGPRRGSERRRDRAHGCRRPPARGGSWQCGRHTAAQRQPAGRAARHRRRRAGLRTRTALPEDRRSRQHALVGESPPLQERDGLLGPRVAPLRRDARAAPLPRDRPRFGRSRARTSWPTRASRRASSSCPSRRRRSARSSSSRSPTSRGSTAGSSSASPSGESAPRAGHVHHPRRSPPPGLPTGPVRLDRRVEPAPDERAGRRCPAIAADNGLTIETRRESASYTRIKAVAIASRRPSRAGDPRHDRRADPQRERRRRAHPDGDRRNERDPPHARRPPPPARSLSSACSSASRARIRARSDVLRRPRLTSVGSRCSPSPSWSSASL